MYPQKRVDSKGLWVWVELRKLHCQKKPQSMDELIQPFYTEPDKSPSFSLNDGWSRKRRVRKDLRRPGARHTFDCDDYYEDEDYFVPALGSRQDFYLASKFPDVHPWERRGLLEDFSVLVIAQMSGLDTATHLAEDYTRPLYHDGYSPNYPSALCMYFRRAVQCVVHDWDRYEEMRMDFIQWWFRCADTQMPTPEQQRQFEKEAWYWDRNHKLLLAARRRLARVVVGRLLRVAIKQRAIALYWQEQTQRALCAPGGAGRAADAVAFESEFAQ